MTFTDHDNAAPIPHEAPCNVCTHPFHRFIACECGCSAHPDSPGDGSHPLDDTTEASA